MPTSMGSPNVWGYFTPPTKFDHSNRDCQERRETEGRTENQEQVHLTANLCTEHLCRTALRGEGSFP